MACEINVICDSNTGLVIGHDISFGGTTLECYDLTKTVFDKPFLIEHAKVVVHYRFWEQEILN